LTPSPIFWRAALRAAHSRDYWMDGLRCMSVREIPEGLPRFGDMLDHEGTPVGVLLLIYIARGRWRREPWHPKRPCPVGLDVTARTPPQDSCG
jgi:hypothetical protein